MRAHSAEDIESLVCFVTDFHVKNSRKLPLKTVKSMNIFFLEIRKNGEMTRP